MHPMGDDPDSDALENVAAAWDAEILRRLAELDSGAVRPVPWAEARRLIRGASDGPSGDFEAEAQD